MWWPIYVEDSWVPVVLSYVSPIEINAITLFPFVFSRGKMSTETRVHEAVHFQQYLETLVIGFLLIYLWDYIAGWIKYRNGPQAYANIRAEIEAYDHEHDVGYLFNRKRWRWLLE